ncbi:MMPL family transporter [Ursidibacter sp. B-7004-1]
MARNLTAWRVIYSCLFLGLTLLFCFQLHSQQWLQTDLRTLLPQDQHWSAVQQNADQQQEKTLNRQIIALIGHSDQTTAFELAQQLNQQWQTSGLFQQIIGKTTPDIAQLRQNIQLLSLALLPKAIQQQLLTAPQDYFQDYAQQIVNPFEQNLLPLEQDWLGFGRFVLPQSQIQSEIKWHAENGMLYNTTGEKTWVLLRGILPDTDLINPSHQLATLIDHNRALVEQQQGQLLATGAALFAENAKQKAEKESALMSIIGVSLTLLLLLLVFRTLRVLWLFLPIAFGMVSGIAITVLIFGQIHMLTLVIGTSLIGVLIDFPLHWLTSSLFHREWQAERTMQKLRFTFMISLIVTLLGYGLLGFTALPVLQQTALFSAVALIMAVLATSLFLPKCFQHYQANKRSVPEKNLQIFAKTWQIPTHIERVMLGGLVVFIGIGISLGIHQNQWRDDIRQWVAMPTDLINQAQQISQIAGIELSNQHLLIVADNDEQLLAENQRVSTQLTQLQQQGKLAKFQSLSQWFISPQEQQKFIAKLTDTIRPEDYAILAEIGLPTSIIEDVLKNLPNQPLVTLLQALNTPLGEPWKRLYLEQIDTNKVASVITLSGIKDTAAIAALANNRSVYWQDKPAQLNQAFEQTRNQAAWLKLLSFLMAGLLLWKFFGIQKSVKMLQIPLIAIVMTIGVLGWIGLPISLFTMFGLLLVSAISIDYTAYMQTADEPINIKRAAVTLAAITTLISFTLLGLSSTPAVASFGLSVSLGVIFSVLITFRILR